MVFVYQYRWSLLSVVGHGWLKLWGTRSHHQATGPERPCVDEIGDFFANFYEENEAKTLKF